MYKMINITKETLENNGIEVIVESFNTLWLNEKNIEENQINHAVSKQIQGLNNTMLLILKNKQ